MRIVPPHLNALLPDLANVSKLIEEGELQQARDVLLDALRVANREGIAHPFVSWSLAIVLDYLGDLGAALVQILEALDQDPLSLPLHTSYGIIVGKVRAALTTPESDVPGPVATRMYELLVREQEADEACHVAMARRLIVGSDFEGAGRILDAVTTPSPTNRAAWESRAVVAAKIGDAGEVRRCEAEATACRVELGGVPRMATAGRG